MKLLFIYVPVDRIFATRNSSSAFVMVPLMISIFYLAKYLKKISFNYLRVIIISEGILKIH